MKSKILYVDDEQENLIVFKKVFKKDFDVYVTESPSLALTLISEQNFDILVVDQRMPEMTGVQLLEAIALQHHDFDAIRILLTGYSDMQAIVDAINKGRIYYYCSKPWKYDELKVVFIKAIEFLELNRQNKKLVKDLTKTVKELDTFIYRASHNLKTPITSQLGLLSLLKLEQKYSDSTLVEKMQESIFSLQKTIHKMQALSDTGDSFLKEQYEVNIKDVIDGIILQYNNLLVSKKIQIEVNVVQHDIFYCYREPFKILVECIIENAINFTKNDTITSPKILVEAETQSLQKELVIRISDNGPGIQEEIMPNVFDPFYRGGVDSKGSGLGLFVSKKICDALGGRISISSDGRTGTTVEIVIPNFVK